jgi:carboxypeptidase Q
MRKTTLLIVAIAAMMHLRSQYADSLFISRIATEILINGKAYENLRHLTKNIGARLTASPQMVKAEQWGENILRSSGADKVWLQECKVPHWVRGGKDEAAVFYNQTITKAGNNSHLKQPRGLDVLAVGNSMGTGKKAISADLIEIKSFDELELKKDQLKGKIVFYNYPFNPAFVSPSSAYRDAVGYRSNGASRAAKYGALAVIIRSMSHSTDNFPHTGALRYDSLYPMIPAVAVGLRDADWLSEQLKNNKLSISIKTNGHFLPDTIGHNVIGELTGTEFPDQYITIGGHLDSWDPGEGAHDDGAGIVHTIEILRTFKALGYKPRHTIRFVLFANEENGLRGGEKYADEAVAKKEKHVFALESDAGGFTPRGFGFDVRDEHFSKIIKWKSLFEPYGGEKLVRGGGGADIGPLHEKLGTPAAGFIPDPQRYFDVHHARNDVFETVNKRELELGAINMAALVYLVDKYGL